MTIKRVRVKAASIPKVIAAIRRQGWRYLFTDSRQEAVWVAPNGQRELSVPVAITAAEQVIVTALRYHGHSKELEALELERPAAKIGSFQFPPGHTHSDPVMVPAQRLDPSYSWEAFDLPLERNTVCLSN